MGESWFYRRYQCSAYRSRCKFSPDLFGGGQTLVEGAQWKRWLSIIAVAAAVSWVPFLGSVGR